MHACSCVFGRVFLCFGLSPCFFVRLPWLALIVFVFFRSAVSMDLTHASDFPERLCMRFVFWSRVPVFLVSCSCVLVFLPVFFLSSVASSYLFLFFRSVVLMDQICQASGGTIGRMVDSETPDQLALKDTDMQR